MSESQTSRDASGSSSGNSGSDDGSGEESGSSSSSGSDDESDSGSGSSASSGSSSDGSGSGSDSSSSGDTEDAEEEDEEPEEDEEVIRLARKREDFEKMKELSAHMDNIVQRLSTFFPLDDKERVASAGSFPAPAVTELPPLPLSAPANVRDRAVCARVLTMDRAVSARRLLIDRAVSAASGLHFDDELSGSTASNSRNEEDQLKENQRRGGRQRRRDRKQSTTNWGRDTEGCERCVGKRRVGTRKNDEADGADTAEYRRAATDSWSGKEASSNFAENRLGLKPELAGEGNGSRVPLVGRGANCDLEDSHERLLWDKLRESLGGVAGNEGVPPSPSKRELGAAIDKATADRARKEQQRFLIDEAIAVLLEGSSGSSGSSEDERLENDHP